MSMKSEVEQMTKWWGLPADIKMLALIIGAKFSRTVTRWDEISFFTIQ